jgi:hypothetical protein
MTLEETIARRAHAGQLDKGTPPVPYIEHVARVAAAVEPRYRAVAWLHYVLEDTSETRESLLAARVSAETIDAVEVLTKRDGEPYEAFIARIASSGNCRGAGGQDRGPARQSAARQAGVGREVSGGVGAVE